jgi:uroporphyrin-3 C-methyltransferase
LASDPDPVQIGGPESMAEAPPKPEATTDSAGAADPAPAPTATPKRGRAWFSFFNFLLIVALAAAAGYYWWQQQQVARDLGSTIEDLRTQLAGKAASTRLDSGLASLRGDLGGLGSKLDEYGLEQQGLRESSEKLYELFGRDRNDWQLAEVEYLMRVAQHKLMLQDDFEGAAVTLQAASDRIALTADPGLVPVRILISDEIADLKTRIRPDLVGMTLILNQLGRQVRVLKPGFAVRVEEAPVTDSPGVQESADWLERFNAFINSLVEVRNEATRPSEIEASTSDVGETLEDNLKLARWAVLDRDARQYRLLIEQSLRLFREFYDLDDAANNDFLRQLQALQKTEMKPEKPDIGGSLRELQRILSQRENAPQPAAPASTEAGNG